jgi:hypothetical protein
MFMERVAPVVDATISALARKKFDVDPIAGAHYSRATSIVSSAYKRHGKILETALREGLRESNRHQVWKEDKFRVSRAADGLINDTLDDAAIQQSSLPYGEANRPLPRANPEQCLLATRGKPQRRSKSVRKLIVDRLREHSRKPDEVRERIEKLVPGPYIELFARETKPGWDCWGDQVELFDHGSARTRRQPSNLTTADASVSIDISRTTG